MGSVPMQAVPKRMDGGYYPPNTGMRGSARHQVTGSGCSAAPQVAHRFEAFEEALPCFRVLQAAAVAQSVACRHVAMFDGFGRLAVRSVQAPPDVPSAWAGGRYGLDVRLMTIGDHCVWDHPGPLDGLPKERLSAGRVAALTEQHVDDHAVFVDGSIEIPPPFQRSGHSCSSHS